MHKALKYSLILFLTFTYSFADSQKLTLKELKEIYKKDGISKAEYEFAKKNLSSEDEKKKIQGKKYFSINTKKDKNRGKELQKKLKVKLINKENEPEEDITQKKIEELGEIVKLDSSYYPKKMQKAFLGCNNSFKCVGQKAGTYLYKAFNRSQRYNQQHPGSIIKAMAMFEVFYAQKLYSTKENLERYKSDDYKKKKIKNLSGLLKKLKFNEGILKKAGIESAKQKDEKEIRSLFSINKGRKGMREALGMSLDTPTDEAIKKFWLLGEFLDLGVPQKNEKVDPELEERQKLLDDYKFQIANLKKKLQNDKEDKEKKTN